MRAAVTFAVATALVACTAPSPRSNVATAWPEAEALFRQDPRWRGADGAYSVDLGGGRRLWLFGDTFVARPGAHGRSGCAMPRNTIGLQEGADPTTARMTVAWRGSAETPTAWFPEDGKVWHWPLCGLRVDDSVIVFCSNVESTGEDGPFGFRGVGWTAFRVRGIGGPLDRWSCEKLATPPARFPVAVGTAVIADGDSVIAYGEHEPGNHDVYALRWSREDFGAGRLLEPEWFDSGAWRKDAEVTSAPRPIVEGGAPEFTVHRAPDGRFVMVQILGFPAGEVAVREAPRPEGPWSEARILFHPPECERDGVFVYAGKAHAGLWDGGLCGTYATNAADFGRAVRDTTLYYPRCVRLPWSVLLEPR